MEGTTANRCCCMTRLQLTDCRTLLLLSLQHVTALTLFSWLDLSDMRLLAATSSPSCSSYSHPSALNNRSLIKRGPIQRGKESRSFNVGVQTMPNQICHIWLRGSWKAANDEFHLFNRNLTSLAILCSSAPHPPPPLSPAPQGRLQFLLDDTLI